MPAQSILDKPITIAAYNEQQSPAERDICELLQQNIEQSLPAAESKIWHAHPVWFLDGNPIVGYSKRKNCVSLLFWSGQSFNTPGLAPEGSFKAAEKRYTALEQVNAEDLHAWLAEARTLQWDYKNIAKKRRLDPLF